MVSFTTAKLPIPKSWEEFEDMISDVIQIAWKDPFTIRHGRQGQKQDGVDIYGKPYYLNGSYAGVQCKNTTISKEDIKEEIKKAENFKPPLKEFIVATTSKRDSQIQEDIRVIDEERTNKNKFSVRVLFWEDICLKLAENEDLMIKHFPQFVEKSASLENIYKKIMMSEVGDWKFEDIGGIYVYKKDANLTIRRDGFENSRPFEEEWVKKFADPKGRTDEHIIFYANTPIERIYLVSVDGARCSIPYPNLKEMSITSYQYKLGKIINDSFHSRALYDFEGYLRKAVIKVAKE